ncbi:hypothetical protein C4J81_10420 [Deltaproteobacteria bacterium Smac51]|nr:hypothetical protein C4J81_10420 [Deltaproteobacteria bacterium Smac51]
MIREKRLDLKQSKRYVYPYRYICFHKKRHHSKSRPLRRKTLKAITRKKQPELVRQNILQAASDIASEQGLEYVTTPEVAKRAGVTSGAFFHHFPSKKHLIDELLKIFMQDFETSLEEHLVRDPEVRGRFTRAYLRASFNYDHRDGDTRLLGAIITALNRNKELADHWEGWLENQLKKYGREKDPVLGSIIRYAADGLWMEAFCHPTLNLEERQSTLERLLEWTRKL